MKITQTFFNLLSAHKMFFYYTKSFFVFIFCDQHTIKNKNTIVKSYQHTKSRIYEKVIYTHKKKKVFQIIISSDIIICTRQDERISNHFSSSSLLKLVRDIERPDALLYDEMAACAKCTLIYLRKKHAAVVTLGIIMS